VVNLENPGTKRMGQAFCVHNFSRNWKDAVQIWERVGEERNLSMDGEFDGVHSGFGERD